MASDQSTLRKVTRWTGCVSSLLVMVLGIVHLAMLEASLHWPDGKFIDDINMLSWRLRMFTFVPDAFADIWTPFFMGLLGLIWHFEKTVYKTVMDSFAPYFLFMFLTAMFGCLGYNGGLGILFSIPCYITCLLSLIIFFWEDAPVSLLLNRKLQSNNNN